jgi:hypothetical protein
MKKLIATLFILSMIILGTSCNGDKAPEEKFNTVHSLSNYGLTMEIKGPEDLKIEKKESMLPYEFAMEGTDFKVYLTGDAAENTDVKVIKENMKTQTKELSEGFEVVNEDDQGFVFSRTYPQDTNKYYNFYYIVLQGDTQFKFTSTTVTPFSKEQIEDMYKAVQQ